MFKVLKMFKIKTVIKVDVIYFVCSFVTGPIYL